MQKKGSQGSLGRSLYRAKAQSSYIRREAGTDEIFVNMDTAGAPAQGSITDRNDLDEFLATAELAESEFTAERVTTADLVGSVGTTKVMSKRELERLVLENKHIIRVPRRPNWRNFTSAGDLKRAENAAFLDWRKQLATMENQEGFVLTPFERNIEMWRQLWRVVETADLLVQIVDARNPLLFYCEDLVEYAGEIKPDMRHLLLVNKADLLSESQKNQWSEYFSSRGIAFRFFSATLNAVDSDTDVCLHPDDASRSDLLDLFESSLQTGGNVGFVGYPNVGKSSTINAIIGEKRVSVAATPGKTKHFQTIHLGNGIVLCDCPGLVFPNVSSSRAELVVNGILPIDQMRDYISPATHLCTFFPKAVLEAVYGITIVAIDQDTGEELLFIDYSTLLSCYAIHRGFRTSNFGNPDESRAARIVLKDMVSGKLLYCYPPPGIEADLFNEPNFSSLLYANKERPRPKIQLVPTGDSLLVESAGCNTFSKQPNGLASYSRFTIDKNQAKPTSSKKHFKMNKNK